MPASHSRSLRLLTALVSGAVAVCAQNTLLNVQTGLGESGSLTLTDGASWSITTTLSRFSITGSGSSIDPLTAFCIELEQGISDNTTATFLRSTNVALAGRGSANSGSPTFGLPTGLGAAGGIGADRAGRIHALISTNWVADPNDSWWTETLNFVNVPDADGDQRNIRIANARTYAMQLAIWEIAYDPTPGFLGPGTFTNWGWDGSLLSGNPNATGLGTLRVETASNTDFRGSRGSAGNGRALNAIKALAQHFINQAVASPRSSGAVVFLSDGFAPGTGTQQDLVAGSVTVIPEPSTWALIGGLGALALALVRRKRRSAVR